MASHDHEIWTVNLGRWAGVRVRLHIFFLLFAAISLYLCWFGSIDSSGPGMQWVALTSLAILLVSVMLHELSHFFAASRLGGMMHQSVLVPWGGVSTYHLPRDPYSEVMVHLAGPMANAAICLVCLPPLVVFEQSDVIGLLHPLRPLGVEQGILPIVLLKLTFWINWLLLLVNLVPAFPFDGGRALGSALSRWLGRRQAGVVVARSAIVAAFGLVLLAWWVSNLDDTGPTPLIPIWFALVLLAIFLFFSASQEPDRRQREPSDEELFGYDFSQGYTSLERSTESIEEESPSPISQWLEQRRQARQQRERDQEADEERRVDEILAQLHDKGMDSLSEKDRALLERVSARYRNRMGESG